MESALTTAAFAVLANLVALGPAGADETTPGNAAALPLATQAHESYGPTPCRSTVSTKEEMQSAAQKWLDALDSNGFVLETRPLHAKYQRKSHTPLPNYIEVADGEWQMTIGFKTVVSPDMSIEVLKGSVEFVANSGYPVPALTDPHWRIEASTPASSTQEGIEVLESAPGRMRIRVRYPRFFAVYGIDQRSDVFGWADVSTPESCYFQIRKDYPGTLTFTFAIENW